MVIFLLILLGLCAGSFVNALVWRTHKQLNRPKKSKAKVYSMVSGRSVCTHCEHKLATSDLIPIVSWLMLKARCRYCHKPISTIYPIVEAVVALLFVGSYVFWPLKLDGLGWYSLVAWLLVLVPLVALFVYDLRWMLLPNKIVYPTLIFVLLVTLVWFIIFGADKSDYLGLISSLIISSGLFYLLFQVSKGKWIGGGDVKLGAVLGIIAQTPPRSVLLLFTASLMGTLFTLPLMIKRKVKYTSRVPFGPFLILAAVVVVLFGSSILNWYTGLFLGL